MVQVGDRRTKKNEGRGLFSRLFGRSAASDARPQAALELADIQGFILRGYRMPMVRHFLLTVGIPSEARKLLGRFVSGNEADAPQITFGRYTGDTPERAAEGASLYESLNPGEPRLPNELLSRQEMRDNPPHVLLTNYAMLEYLLLRPDDSPLFDGPSSGHTATPNELPSCDAARSATAVASAAPVSGSRRANSSPPMRKAMSDERQLLVSTCAVLRRMRSPSAWPELSFTALKPSRSNSATLTRPP